MAEANFHQPGFLGGEWSTLSQGRIDLPMYKQAMNLSLNGFPLEEGAWTRRSGFQWMAYTRGRTKAKLLPLLSSTALPYLMEFTHQALRLHYGTGPVCTNDRRAIDTATLTDDGLGGLFPAYVGELYIYAELDMVSGWAAGDSVRIVAPEAAPVAEIGWTYNRTFKVIEVSTTTLVLGDDQGEPLNPFLFGLFVTDPLAGSAILRVLEFVTPYDYGPTDQISYLQQVQAGDRCIILSGDHLPQVVTFSQDADGDADPELAFDPAEFVDGPYLDPQGGTTTPETGTVSGYSGSITFTPATSTFSATDVSRHIRLFSQPPDWDAGTTYAYGETVTYPPASNQYWRSLAQNAYATANVGIVPGSVPPLSTGISVNLWAPAPEEGRWAWGKITAQATTSCTVALETELNSANGATVSIWRLGLYTSGTYPTCGVYHEGRLHLGGAAPNRADASVPNDILNFSPTDEFGTVTDNHAIAYTLNAKDVNEFYWMEPDHQGIIIGTPAGEWLLSASDLNDPITPSSRQAHRVTEYKGRSVRPLRVGYALLFAQLYGKRIIEYLASTVNGRFEGLVLNERARQAADPGIKEIVYQEEPAPIVWVCREDGGLSGVTYRRRSRFATDDPAVNAWHRHQLGDDWGVNSICALPDVDPVLGRPYTGVRDRLYACTYNSDLDYSVEVLTAHIEESG